MSYPKINRIAKGKQYRYLWPLIYRLPFSDKGPFINDVSSIFRIYEGVPTLVSPRLLWLNDPLEETSFLRPTAPLPPPIHLCIIWGSYCLYFNRDEMRRIIKLLILVKIGRNKQEIKKLKMGLKNCN